ncbi:arsenic transporter [Candidimonas nitroreducens]|uniref:Arsenical efflux pump membrane protein ArsB n=1 Tax=Candidimonas nitroreducens TaxID=683354 RepID=A0A225M672_9BURK|nr:arsenic transporter [Candidimonas nitroreducens]OWT55610.1 arsenical efflux pump membrane protein ArsB [Candidimonas nitroreducens]
MPALPEAASISSAAALAIFAATLFLVVRRPRGLDIGWSALAGAALCLALGLVHGEDVLHIWHMVWNATATLVAIIISNSLLDEAGFFKWLALHVVRWGRGHGRRLFIMVVLFGACVSGLLTNDGAALILTPIVVEILVALGLTGASLFAFVLAAGFIADTASLPLTVSNLVNILSADFFGLDFGGYAAVMLPVNLVSIAASLAVLLLYFGRLLPRRYELGALPAPASAIRDRRTFHAGWVLLLATLAGFFFLGRLHVPTSAIAGTAALVLLLVAGRGRAISTRRLMRRAPWNIVFFSLGMYLIVLALRNAGLLGWLSALFQWLADAGLWAATLGTGLTAAFLSSITNNLPGVLLGMLSIQDSHAPELVRQAMVYANIIGSDLGPKITPIGSLATLLWLHVLAGRGIRIGWGAYFRTGIVLTLPVLLCTLAALAAWLQITH